MSDQVPVKDEVRYRLFRPSALSPLSETDGTFGLTRKEERRLETLQRMIDRLEHRAADPTFRKSHWMAAELSALKWAVRVLRGDPHEFIGAAIRDDRTRERRA